MRVFFRFLAAAWIVLGALAMPPLPRDTTNFPHVFALGLREPEPQALTSLSPATVAAGSPAFTLTVNGAGFVAGMIVRWNGSDRATTFLSSTQLDAAIPAADVISGGPFAVTVYNPADSSTADPINLLLYQRSALDALPDGILGQPNFETANSNNPLLPGGANRLHGPTGVAIDPNSGRLFVADWSNHRVLSWPNVPAFANAQAADLVLGQPDFTTITPNTGGISASSLRFPESLALDAAGNLYVADWGNSRVLEYDAPLETHAAAVRVFGQPDFASFLSNNPSLGDSSLFGPTGVALDAAGNLYVADAGNNRVLEYDAPLTGDRGADRVFGQQDFSTNDSNPGGIISATSLHRPTGIALDLAGNLYVADSNNHRVLEYNAPLTGDQSADHVFGQPGFTTAAANLGDPSPSSMSLFAPGGVAANAAGSLYVVDGGNQRVLVYTAALTTDPGADLVVGQPGFTTFAANNPTRGSGLSDPAYCALDAAGSLYVSDFFNNRLLEYDQPAAAPMVKIYLPVVIR